MKGRIFMKVLKNERGQSLIEFTIILPIILIILMGIFEFGIMINSYLTINNAARESSRLAAVGGTDIEVINMALSRLPNLDTNNIMIEVTPSGLNRVRGESVTVKITYNYQVITPIISNIINNSVNLIAKNSMRIE